MLGTKALKPLRYLGKKVASMLSRPALSHHVAAKEQSEGERQYRFLCHQNFSQRL